MLELSVNDELDRTWTDMDAFPCLGVWLARPK